MIIAARTLGAVVAVLFASSAWARDFRSSDTSPENHPTVQAVAFMGDLLRERTKGRLTISNTGQNDPESESFAVAQLRNGTLDMARVNLAVLNVSVPGTVVPTLPFLFKSTEHMRRTLDGPIGENLLAGLERNGLIGLCFYEGGVRSFYSRLRPIRSVSDLKGMRVRVQRADSWAVLLRALGAEPVAMPTGQIRAAFQTGVIDAADGDWAAYVTGRHYTVAPYYSLTQHSQPPSVLVFSQQVWRTLSPEDRALIRTAARESVGHMRSLVDEYEAAARHVAEIGGARVVEGVDRQSFNDALVPLYPTVVEEARLQETVSKIQADQ